MKHDKDAIDHSFGVGSGIPTDPLIAKANRAADAFGREQALARQAAKPPRPWREMLDAWGALLGSLCDVLSAPEADKGRRMIGAELGLGYTPLHLIAWRWMWSQAPCSMARKAAFTLGHAALLVERWRAEHPAPENKACAHGAEPWCKDCLLGMRNVGTGQRAEALLNILRWQIDDARGEADGQRLHGAPAPSIPLHERVYSRGVEASELPEGAMMLLDLYPHGIEEARVILDHEKPKSRAPGDRAKLDRAFAETAIASLPDGPWVMTSSDVSRFLDAILEDAPKGDRAGRVPDAGLPQNDAYHAHLDGCEQCANRPFDLCKVGADLLRATVRGAQ